MKTAGELEFKQALLFIMWLAVGMLGIAAIIILVNIFLD